MYLNAAGFLNSFSVPVISQIESIEGCEGSGGGRGWWEAKGEL